MLRPRSWVVVDKRTGEAVMETFERRIADMINETKFEVVPTLEWLQRVNAGREAQNLGE